LSGDGPAAVLCPARRFTWPGDVAAARRLQERLRARVVTEDRLEGSGRVAGVDVHYDRRRRLTFAAAVRLAADGTLAASALAARPTRFPYVPGYLAFREAPAALEALTVLGEVELLFVDGHGLAHPRRFGIACHLGVLLDRPTVGVAKTRLVGRYAEPAAEAGSWTPLEHRGEVVGAVVRTRTGVRPVFVSVGHRLSLATAVRLTLAFARGFRLPEPTRLADRLSRAHGG